MDLFSGFDTAPLRVKRPLQDGSEQDPNKKHKPEATTQVSFVDYQEQEFETIDVQGCVHEVCYPPFFSKDEKAQTSANESPAKTYPFELDIFQKQSISCLERLESVLVSAHTSAGKTVVAEYAIAMALRDRQRVIYTSPIKALSNQKFRELQKEFKDVGLMTGDVVINPGASCLVMTTEILRNMLYRGSEVVREVAWIIYDEIHYMSDKVRGVVWEESIILLPHSVRFVFLSATIPNAREFCFWIAKLHRHPCNVVYTDRRPVPLQHYVMPRGGKGLHLVVDKDGTFKTENFQRALDEVKEDAPSAANKPMRRTREANQDKCSDISKLARMLKAKDMCPVIFFAFSMRDCEDRARELAKIDFIDDTMKEAVTEVFSSAISNLKEEDRELPQVLEILPILQRGIGIHHAGLLPILKEVVEILFQEGLLRVMFSTETFSMGINFPARTVVFTNLSKFDGVEKRIVTPGEYIQMSGRAGRRGLDTQGIVILMMENKIEPHIAKETMKGKADTLNSSFYVGFNMLLNLLRLEDADPEYVIVRSFAQFQSTRTAPEALARIEELRHAKEDLEKQVQNLAIVKDYVRIQKEIDLATQKIRVIRNRHIHPYLNPGRLFRVIHQGEDFGWGILVRSITVDSTDSATNKKKKDSVILDILLSCDKSLRTRKPAPLGSLSSAMRVLPTTLEAVAEISALRMKIDDNKALSQSDLNQHGINLKRALTKFNEELPLLDYKEDMGITKPEFFAELDKLERLEDALKNHEFESLSGKEETLSLYKKVVELDKRIETAESDLKVIQATCQNTYNIKNRKRVLRKLGHLDADNMVTIKGRVACEITTVDELLCTELVFSGAFAELEIEQIVALLSCLVFGESSSNKNKPMLREEVLAPLGLLKSTAKTIAETLNEQNVPKDVDEYVDSFKPELMDVVYAWAQQAPFAEVCRMTDIYEGSIVRAIRRLDELLSQLIKACVLIGNKTLEVKFKQCQDRIKRDIVFAASLYTDEEVSTN